jgi:hypothetical protein
MDFMTDEERIDEIIRNAASDYNRPPATPMDEMWTAIQSAQKSAGPRLHVTAGGASRSAPEGDRAAGRFSPKFMWIGWAAAAALLLATGVGIGRWTNDSAPATAQQDSLKQYAESPSNTPVAPPNEVGPSAAPEVEAESPEKAPPRDSQPVSKGRSRDEILKDPKIVRTGGTAPRFANIPQNTNNGYSTAPVNTTYQVATQRHLADAEALLTSFSLGTRDQRMDAQFAVWAKGLLSNTRLLLDSPAGEDPRRARLLQDLELVLAQIVQLSPNAAAQDRELIQGSIQSENVMTRLRTAIPAGQPREITER